MSFPSYPNYSGSSIGPDRRLPSHWRNSAIKRAFSVTLGKMVTSSEVQEVRQVRPYLRSANVQNGYLQLEDIKSMWFSDQEIKSLTLRIGDLVVCEGGDVGRSAIIKDDLEGCGFQNSVNRVRPLPNFSHSTSFLQYWLSFLKTSGFIDVICNKATIAHYPADKLANTPMFEPPVHEQQAVAAFLDRETAKIDNLIAEQERMIALLEEKRQAVIFHAVTKGLDPSAPMKDSGVEWTAEIPVHWMAARLGYFALIENGMTPSRDRPELWENGLVPWVASGEVNQTRVLEPSALITESAVSECGLRIFPVDTVLVGMIGQGRTRGMASLMKISAALNQNVAGIICGNALHADYLLYQLRAAYAVLREYGRGGNQAALNCEILTSFKITLPPFDEQQAIAKKLSEDEERIFRLKSEAEFAVTLLNERRSALISAAVTGKIDVRGLVDGNLPIQAAAE